MLKNPSKLEGLFTDIIWSQIMPQPGWERLPKRERRKKMGLNMKEELGLQSLLGHCQQGENNSGLSLRESPWG